MRLTPAINGRIDHTDRAVVFGLLFDLRLRADVWTVAQVAAYAAGIAAGRGYAAGSVAGTTHAAGQVAAKTIQGG